MERLTPSAATDAPGAAEPKKPRKRKSGRHGNGRANIRPPEPLIAEPPHAEAPRAEPPRAEAPRADAPRAKAHREPPPAAPAGAGPQAVDIEAFSRNIARVVEQGGRALAAYLKPREEGRASQEGADLVTDAVKTLGHR